MRSHRKTAAKPKREAIALPADRRKVVIWIGKDRKQTEKAELALAETGVRLVLTNAADAGQLKADLADAALVICQAGCVSHGDWWRVKDYCSRTGKQCVLVEQPGALDWVIASRAPVGSVG